MTAENRTADRDSLTNVITKFIPHIAVIADVKEYLQKIADDERGFARVRGYSEVSVAQENLFGDEPKVLIEDWKPTGETKSYPLNRSVEWTEGLTFTQMPPPADDQRDDEPVEGESEIRAHFTRAMEKGKHSQRQIVSLIDIPLWNRASWMGTMFFSDPDKMPYPVLALGFKDRDAAAQIFKGLISKIGYVDKDNRLRVIIVRGITKRNPAAYRVVVGANFDGSKGDRMIVMMVTRNNVMEPTTTENLDLFLTSMQSTPEYFIAPAHYNGGSGRSSIGFGLAIQKSGLVVRNAWELALGEVDAMGLSPEDDPVVPTDVENPPCNEVIAFLKSKQRG